MVWIISIWACQSPERQCILIGKWKLVGAILKANQVLLRQEDCAMSLSKKYVKSMFGRIEAYEDDLITKQIETLGNHTRPEFAFATCILDSGDHIFDIGAHIGTFTMQARRAFGKTGRAVCVEGTTETFEILCKNLARMRFKNCQTVNAIVSGSEMKNIEMPTLEKSADLNTGGNSVLLTEVPNEKIVTIDELVEEYFEPTYIKLDIEGCEAHTIMDSKFIANNKPALYFEVAISAISKYGIEVEKLDEFLRNIGYSFFVNIGPRNERFNGFKVKEIERISNFEPFFDVLAVANEYYKNLLKSISV